MTTNTNNQNVLAAYKRARADIASLAAWIEDELDKYDDAEVTWATVGSLEYVRNNLMETLESFSSVPRTEIQRNLDELHS